MEIQGYQIPEELYYGEDHAWVRPEGDIAVIGIDDFAQKLAGEIVYVQLPEEGKVFRKGKRLAKLESGKWLGKILSPVTGELIAVNEDLEMNPALINEDCYGKGWIFHIRMENPDELGELLHDPAAIQQWMEAEIAEHAG
jgi:glycine cleavage system H protein